MQGDSAMKKSRFSDSQILSVLKQAENGIPVPELCREHGISSATFYKWRAKFGGMDASMMARLKELEEENRRLKKMYAEERLKADILKCKYPIAQIPNALLCNAALCGWFGAQRKTSPATAPCYAFSGQPS